MALEEYRRKRDFRHTPEPRGQPRRRKAKRLAFVIQKHAARRLHYDFRLEIGGVLKSWAVPKGPSRDPGERRLAVHVEDHPFDYGEFEGVIPKGEYGAGAVLLWDHGYWEPEGDAAKAYRRGHLSFRLEGERLHGRWSLVRTGGEESQNWLLIKADDEYADAAGWDDETSVASGRTLDQIRRAPARLWHPDSGPETLVPEVTGRRAPLPPTLGIPLAAAVDDAPAGDEWLHEIKFDGYRIAARLEDGRVRLVSRNGKDWTGRFGAVAEALAVLPVASAWLDGEITVQEADGTTSFQRLQEALSEGRDDDLVYFLFDLPYLNGNDLRGLALSERKAALEALLAAVGPEPSPLRYVDHIQGSGPAFFEQACRHHLEGVIAKRAGARYRAGRGRDWRKIKCLKRQEFVVGGFTEPAGGRKGLGALLVGVYEGEELRYAGRVGTGFTEPVLRHLRERLDALERPAPAFVHGAPARARGVHWVEPRLVAEVRFTEWTRDGILRQPAYQGLREDKPAREVRREEPRPATQTTPSPDPDARLAAGRALEERLAGLRLSSPDKVLYPGHGLTKRDLAHYYAAVADWVLPDLARRPLTLLRCPDGHHQECFFQKHATGKLPAAIHSVAIAEKGKRGKYLYADGLDGLIGLVQMGVLEIHTWGSRADRTEAPDRVVLDLDPDEGLAWEAVVGAAVEVRERLAQLGLTGFVRTTGGKGLHVVAPLMRRHGWDEVKAFAKALASQMVRDHGRRYTVSPSKKARQGKLFIDYLRNGRGATAIISYGTRARPGAPVATPITWEELKAGVRPDQWTVATVPARLARLAADPWAGYGDLRQSITAKARREVGLRP